MTLYNRIEYLYISDSFLKQLWFVSRLKIQLNLHVRPLLVSYHLQYVTTNPKQPIYFPSQSSTTSHEPPQSLLLGVLKFFMLFNLL